MAELAAPALASLTAAPPGGLPPALPAGVPGAPPTTATGTTPIPAFEALLAAQLSGLAPATTLAAPVTLEETTLAVEETTPDSLLDTEGGEEGVLAESMAPASLAAVMPVLLAAAMPAREAVASVATTETSNPAAPAPELAAVLPAITATPAAEAEETISSAETAPDQPVPLGSAGAPMFAPLAAQAVQAATPADAQGEAGQDLPAPSLLPAMQAVASDQEAADAVIHPAEAQHSSADIQGARLFQQYEQAIRPAEPRTQLAIEAPVRGPVFAQELSEKVVWLTNRQSQVAELTLNPPQLGAVEVRLSLSGTDAGAQFFSANPVVREALENALPRLREMLAQSGIALGDAQVREEAFTRRESGAQGGGGGSRGDDVPVQISAAPIRPSVGLGLVDLYA